MTDVSFVISPIYVVFSNQHKKHTAQYKGGVIRQTE